MSAHSAPTCCGRTMEPVQLTDDYACVRCLRVVSGMEVVAQAAPFRISGDIGGSGGGLYISPIDCARLAPTGGTGSLVGPEVSAALKAIAHRKAEYLGAKIPAGVPTGVSCTYGAAKPIDPLDVECDGLSLRFLLKCFRLNQQENETSTFTPAQRAAISAHWSAQLRAKVQAGEAADKARRPSVVVDVDAEDLPW